MKKLKPNDLSFKSKTVSEISKSNAPKTKELDTIGETACNGDTNITCFETEGENCPGETFASACMCASENCTVNCESLGCTKTQGMVCCDLSQNPDDCAVRPITQDKKTCVCVVTNDCVESADEPCHTVITDQDTSCTCALTNGMNTCDCEAIQTVGC